MNIDPVTIRYKNSRLTAVPAIHYSHIFASGINRICRNDATRPEAIAVELGPQSCEAVKKWIKELGAGLGQSKKLPVMLGLTKRNRMIRASLRQKAIDLQKTTGKDLSELPPEILYKELGLKGRNVLCISPTDSIIEAIRCALEFNLPVYGIDKEEVPDSIFTPVMIQNPITAYNNFKLYISNNSPLASHQRDEEIDGPREIVMAACLKTLLMHYRRVLFTCGMAHWTNIIRLLEDSAIQPAASFEPKCGSQVNFNRVLIHPLVAVNHLDVFPKIAEEYEKIRKLISSDYNRCNKRIRIDPYSVFNKLLKEACRDYFCTENRSYNHDTRNIDLASLNGFMGYLEKVCLVNLRPVPDFSLIMNTAHRMMSPSFVKILFNTLMDISWVTPDEFPDYEIIYPPENENDFDDNFYNIYPTLDVLDKKFNIDLEYNWGKKKKMNRPISMLTGLLHTWRPWEFLLSALSFQAIEGTKKESYEKRSELYKGSLSEGIDFKATIRSFCSGQDQIYVKENAKKRRNKKLPVDSGFPVIWILQPGRHPRSSWIVLFEQLDWLKKYFRNRMPPPSINKKDDRLITFIGYGDTFINNKVTQKIRQVRCDRLYGICLFQPMCFSKIQFARWLELTGAKRNPFYRENSHELLISMNLLNFFHEKYGMLLKGLDWETSLMLMSIPFSKDFITIITPRDYRINPVVFERAQQYNIGVSRVYLEQFSKQHIKRLSLNYLLPTDIYDPVTVFPKSYEETIGESQQDNQKLIPDQYSHFGSKMG